VVVLTSEQGLLVSEIFADITAKRGQVAKEHIGRE
jgi:hypothetical protein